MPQYDYRCQDCRETYTIERSMTETIGPVCTACGSTKSSRIWNMFIRTGGVQQDVGQGTQPAGTATKSGCGSCSSHACGTCH